MNVLLAPKLKKFIENKVESGMYNSASEVVAPSTELADRVGQGA